MADALRDTPSDPPVVRLGRAARAWRACLVLVLAVLFLAGSAVGDDHWWPFGPWRMFATSTAPTGGVAVHAIESRTAGGDWRPADLSLRSVGLTRAEIEGRAPDYARNPAMLGTLARTHSRLRPGEPTWTGVRVVRIETVVRDRRPTGERRRTVVASWELR